VFCWRLCSNRVINVLVLRTYVFICLRFRSIVCSIFQIAPGAYKLFPFGGKYEELDDAMFATPAFKRHAKNVVSMLDNAVQFLGPEVDVLEETLKELGARHVGYGVMPEHYPIVGQALLKTLATALGPDKFTAPLKEAWAGVYGFVTSSMLQGANESLLRLSFPVHQVSMGKSSHKISLDEYMCNMKPGQKQLFYVAASQSSDDATLAILQRLDQADVAVLRLTSKQSSTTVQHLEKYLGRKMVNLMDSDKEMLNMLDLSFLEATPTKKMKGTRRLSPTSVTMETPVVGGSARGLGPAEARDFCTWLQKELGPDKVVACTPTCRFASLPARVIRHEGEDMQDTVQQLEDFDCMPLPKKHVEINPGHAMIVEIHGTRIKRPEMAKILAEQVYDNCQINAGIMDDCRSMVHRVNEICMGWMKEAKTNVDDVDCYSSS
jgi:Hsp90 protein/Globin